MHLVESAPFNKVNNNNKVYSGVPGNLVAFACKRSFKLGYEGCVSFLSKPQLIEHYEKILGAFHFGGRIMIIKTTATLNSLTNIIKMIKMKTKAIELEIDFIGAQEGLAEAEDKALSNYFKQRKLKVQPIKTVKKRRTTKQEKPTAS